MFYKEFLPHPRLSAHIECYWILESDDRPFSLKPQKVLPDGCIELIFHFKSRNKRLTLENRPFVEPRSFVSGQIKQYIEIKPTGLVGVFGIRFLPAGAYPFLQLPIDELTEKTVGLDSIFGKAGRDLESKILESFICSEKIRHAESFLLKQYDPHYEPDAIVISALRQIIHFNGQIAIDFLSRKIDITSRQLERKFKQTVGLTPKTFSRIIRFQKLLNFFGKSNLHGLTSLGLDCGYYDQAHFIHEFKVFTGDVPTTYLAQEHTMSDFFTSSNRMSNFYNSF